jgi:multisubunit Na+/H+ antiporter MnhB subunit
MHIHNNLMALCLVLSLIVFAFILGKATVQKEPVRDRIILSGVGTAMLFAIFTQAFLARTFMTDLFALCVQLIALLYIVWRARRSPQ